METDRTQNLRRALFHQKNTTDSITQSTCDKTLGAFHHRDASLGVVLQCNGNINFSTFIPTSIYHQLLDFVLEIARQRISSFYHNVSLFARVTATAMWSKHRFPPATAAKAFSNMAFSPYSSNSPSIIPLRNFPGSAINSSHLANG